MLYIRADGNAEIGTGHIMRCLSIAQSVHDLGQECVFIVADQEMTPLLSEQGIRYICLHSVWNNLDEETVQMEELIRQESIRTLLVDSYFVTPDYLQRLNQLTHVAYMDDLDQFIYPCSTLINYNIYASQLDYVRRYPNSTLLLGPRYVPLRKEFQGLPQKSVRKDIRDVLVSTGGSDPLNIAGKLIQKVVQMPALAGITFHVVAGRFNRYLSMLEQLERMHPGVKIHHNVQRMSQLMLACDAAISAAGSTLYELCACGLPTVTYVLADNQIKGAAAFEEAGLMLHGGDVRTSCQFAQNVFAKLKLLAEDAPLRVQMSRRMQELVDGKGATRFARSLVRLKETEG